MENRLLMQIRVIRIPCDAVQTYKCASLLPRHDKPHLEGPLRQGVIVYIDDMLIYTKNEEIHDELVKEVLEWLAKNDLVITPEKYVWGENEVEFLGYILTPQGMRMAEDKTKAIQE
jgi:hypothetical protein